MTTMDTLNLVATARELARMGGYTPALGGWTWNPKATAKRLSGLGEVLARRALAGAGFASPRGAMEAADRAARGSALAHNKWPQVAHRLGCQAGVLRFIALVAMNSVNSANVAPPRWIMNE